RFGQGRGRVGLAWPLAWGWPGGWPPRRQRALSAPLASGRQRLPERASSPRPGQRATLATTPRTRPLSANKRQGHPPGQRRGDTLRPHGAYRPAPGPAVSPRRAGAVLPGPAVAAGPGWGRWERRAASPAAAGGPRPAAAVPCPAGAAAGWAKAWGSVWVA